MSFLVYAPLVLPVLLSLLARRLTWTAAPQAAARRLAVGAIVTAAAGVGCLALLTLTLLDDLPAMERRERAALLFGVMLPEPVPDPVGFAAGALLAIVAWRVGVELRRRRDVMRTLRAAGVPNEGLLVADWDRPHAVAVPTAGREPGYVLVTSGLLRMLEPDERAAVLAHERAHLRYRHHRICTAVALAAAAHPMLRPLVGAVGLLAERAADEDAAATVGDRRLVARVVAKVALASRPAAPGTLGIGGSSLMRRVAALSGPSAVQSRTWTWLAAAVALIAVAATAGALGDFVRLALTWWP